MDGNIFNSGTKYLSPQCAMTRNVTKRCYSIHQYHAIINKIVLDGVFNVDLCLVNPKPNPDQIPMNVSQRAVIDAPVVIDMVKVH